MRKQILTPHQMRINLIYSSMYLQTVHIYQPMPFSHHLHFCHYAICAAICTLASPAQAELPLTIEELLTDQGKVRLDLSLAYANREQQGLATADPVTVQTGATSFVTLPSLVSQAQSNSDTLVGSLGLRYGLTPKTELYGRASYLYQDSRSSAFTSTASQREHRFADAWAGLNYQFKADDATPALLGFIEAAVREKHRTSSASLKSWMVGFTTYTAIDPVVLSLTSAYRINQARQDDSTGYKPGNFLLISPSVALAVNERISLTTGLQWSNRQADRINGMAQGFRRTSTNLQLGLGYGLTGGGSVNLSFSTQASGQNGADLRLSWLRTL